MALLAATLGILALAAAMAGFFFHRLGWMSRLALFVAAGCALYPGQVQIGGYWVPLLDLLGIAILAVVAVMSWRQRERPAAAPPQIEPA